MHVKMQQAFLVLTFVFYCFVDFATSFTDISISKSNKTTSLMMKAFVQISPVSLSENLSLSMDNEATANNSAIKTMSSLLSTETATIISSSPTKRQIKLNARQNIIMNQIIGAYALSGIEDQPCKNHTMEFKSAIRNFESWALKMFDSSSKLQAGIFMGNLMEYGSFRQCIEIYANSKYGPIRGQHCTIKITPNEDLMRYVMSYRNISQTRFKKVKKIMLGAALLWSVCIPDSCSYKDALRHFNKTILSITEGLALNISLEEKSCYTIKDEMPLGQTEWFVISGLFILFVVTAICTFSDVKNQNANVSKSNMVEIFSAFSNVKKLLHVRTEKQALDCLNGIRFLSICYVVLGHSYLMSLFFPLINALDVMDWVLYYTSTIIIGGTISVDTFFMISGLLVTYTFFEQMSKGAKFNLGVFILHRYLRVTPALMIVALVHGTLIQYFGSGPLWKRTFTFLQKPCQYFWWATMLHIQSYVNAPYICILPTWYLTCDTIFYFFSPVIIYPLWKWPIIGYTIFTISYIVSIAVSFYLAWANKYNAEGLLSNQFLQSDYFNYHYIVPHTRASTFIIGIGLGYLLFKTKNIEIKMTPLVVVLGWMCSFSLMLVSVLGTHQFQLENREYNAIEHSLFLSCSRSAWTLGVAWMVWACSHGYGGPIDYLLSFPTYQILGRISYGVFLTHMGTQFLIQGSSKLPGYYSDFNVIYKFCGDILIHLLGSFFLTLFFESPIIKAESLLMKKLTGNRRNNNAVSDFHNEKVRKVSSFK